MDETSLVLQSAKLDGEPELPWELEELKKREAEKKKQRYHHRY